MIHEVNNLDLNFYQTKKYINELSIFLDKNKNILSKYEIGKGYLELQCRSADISSATKFYNLTNKYLYNEDIESTKINMNRYLDFCENLKNGYNISLNTYNLALKNIIYFYKTFCNLEENEIKLLLKDNIEEKKI